MHYASLCLAGSPCCLTGSSSCRNFAGHILCVHWLCTSLSACCLLLRRRLLHREVQAFGTCLVAGIMTLLTLKVAVSWVCVNGSMQSDVSGR